MSNESVFFLLTISWNGDKLHLVDAGVEFLMNK